MSTALSLEEKPSTEEPQQFLSLFLPPDTQAILSTQQLVEILHLYPKQIALISGVPASVIGVCNWRGEALWLIDLGQLLGKTPLYNQAHHQLCYNAVVVQCQDCMIGLVINQVRQIYTCDLQSFLIPANQNNSKLPPCVQGYWITPNDETLWVLNCEALVNFFRAS